MRIVHVSNFVQKGDWNIFFHTSYKLSFGMTRLGHAVYNFSDRDVARDSGLFRIRNFGIAEANRRLIAACRNIRPDLIVLGHADIIEADTIAEIRAGSPGLRVAQWNYDPLSSEDNCRRIEGKLAVVDATFATTAGSGLDRFSRPGHVACFLPNPVDDTVETGRAFEAPDGTADLIFPARDGATPRAWGGRLVPSAAIAAELRAGLPEWRVRCPGLDPGGRVFGAAYLDALSSSRIGLSLSQRSDQPLYASDRMAHLMACGVLTCIDRATGFDAIIAEGEACFYTDPADLLDRIRWFLRNDDERRRVAMQGWKKAHAAFNGMVVAQYLLERTLGLPLSREYGWPTDVH